MGKFIALVEDHKIPTGSVLLVESLDRLSRADITVQMSQFINLINAGISVVTIGDNERLYSKDTINSNMMDLMMSLLIMSRAHEESAVKSQRSKAMWENKRKGGKPMTSVCPAWVEYDEDSKTYVVIKERVALIRRMFELAKGGVGQHSICKLFNKEGIKTWGRSTAWNESYVGKIISGKAVLGEYELRKMVNGKPTPTGEVVKNYFPRIIDDKTYYAVQATRKKNTRYLGRTSPKCSNLFTGVAKCGSCGGSMIYHQVFNKGDGPNWTYLVCSNSKSRLGCKERSWNYKNFEKDFVEFIRELDFAKVNTATDSTSISKLQSEVAAAEGELTDIEKKLAKLVNIIFGSDNPPKTILNAIATLEEENIAKEAAAAKAQEKLDVEQSQINNFKRSNGDLQDIIAACHDIDKRFKIQQEIRDKIKRIDVYSKERVFVVTFANNAQRVVLPEGSDYQTFRKLFESGVIKMDVEQETLEMVC